MSITNSVAKWIINTDPDSLPDIVVEKAKKSILDTVGVAVAGANTDVGQTMLAYLETLGGNPQSRVWGTAIATSVQQAALANGTIGHVHDFDDTSHSYIGHPSISVLPAVVAAGEQVDASGAEVLLAFVIGTEMACKLGAMVTPKLYADGWHATSVIGAFGAAAGMARLLGLDEGRTAQALSLVAAQTSGIKGNFGTDAKPYQVGRSAENGVAAALLAQRGLKGAADIFEKEFGFCHTLKLSCDSDSISAGLGNPFDIDRPGFYLKEFPSCSSTHPALNAVIKLINTHGIDPLAVENIDCASTQLVVDSLSYRQPQDVNQARFSLQFCLARTLLNRGSLTLADFCPESLGDPQTQALMEKIQLRLSGGLAEKGYAPADGPEAAIVKISMTDGQRHEKRLAFADWRPEKMPSWEALAAKFRDCGSPAMAARRIDRTVEMIRHLEQVPAIREVTALTGTD